MEEKSKEHNVIAIKAILSGLLDPIKGKVVKCSSAKDMWDRLQDLHSKGTLTMTSNQEDDGKQEGNLEPIKKAENKSEDIKTKEDLEDEENEEDLMEKLITSIEEISKLKKGNEELKR